MGRADDLQHQIDSLSNSMVSLRNSANQAIGALPNFTTLYLQEQAQAKAAREAAENNVRRILGNIATLEQETKEKLLWQKNEALRLAKEVLDTADALLRQTEQRANARIDALRKRLDEVREPTSGELLPVERVLEGLYELHREDALRADEYGALGYPGGAYDEEEIQANPYDLYGKLLLAAWNGVIDELTAEEYDALLLSAEAFGAYELSAAKYDMSGKSLLG